MIISSWAVRVRKKRRNSSVGRRTQAPHPPRRRYSLQWNVLFTLYIQVYNWLRLQQWRTERNGKKNRLFGRKPTVYLEGRRSCVDSRNVIWIARRRFQIAEVAWPRPTREKKKQELVSRWIWIRWWLLLAASWWLHSCSGCSIISRRRVITDNPETQQPVDGGISIVFKLSFFSFPSVFWYPPLFHKKIRKFYFCIYCRPFSPAQPWYL